MTSHSPSHLRLLPAVERVLNLAEIQALTERHGRVPVRGWVRQAIDSLRKDPPAPLPATAAEVEALVQQRVLELAQNASAERLRHVINGTGIVIHTNLGRAPLARAAVQAIAESAACTNIEVDISTGHRSRRGAAVEALCQEVTGAEAALIVNNCAAASILTLQTVAAGREVVISRGQMIEIGGSFRLPEVFKQAGVRLHEVGTTNRTHPKDYSQAIGPETAALMRVHPSNYRVSGFTVSVSIAELVALGKAHGLTVMDDVGSGCLYDLTRFGLPEEPIVGESLSAGADLVLFSGDKLLGGPQCGIIVGRAELVAQLRKHPLARALRVDKLTLAALQATLEIHRAGRAFDEIPVLSQLSLSAETIRLRAEKLLERLKEASPSPGLYAVQPVASASGGGALPDQTLASWGVAVSDERPDLVALRLRQGSPAVFARVQDGQTLVDMRTVLPEDEEALLQRLLDCTSG